MKNVRFRDAKLNNNNNKKKTWSNFSKDAVCSNDVMLSSNDVMLSENLMMILDMYSGLFISKNSYIMK